MFVVDGVQEGVEFDFVDWVGVFRLVDIVGVVVGLELIQVFVECCEVCVRVFVVVVGIGDVVWIELLIDVGCKVILFVVIKGQLVGVLI